MIFLLLLPLVVAVWLFARHRRAGVLAGRDADRPVYSVEPPRRRVGSRKRETL